MFYFCQAPKPKVSLHTKLQHASFNTDALFIKIKLALTNNKRSNFQSAHTSIAGKHQPSCCLCHQNLAPTALIHFFFCCFNSSSRWLLGGRVIYSHHYFDEDCKINLYCLQQRHDDWWRALSIPQRDCTVIFSYLRQALLTQNDDTYNILQSVKQRCLICFLLLQYRSWIQMGNTDVMRIYWTVHCNKRK